MRDPTDAKRATKRDDARPRSSSVHTLQRFGGILRSPQTTLRALAGEAATPRDGWILLVVYLLGAKLVAIADTVADAGVMHGLGVLQALIPLVFVVLPWVLTGLGLEILLRRNLSARDELLRVPLVACVLLAGALELVTTLPGPSYAPEIVGGLASLALAWSQRDLLLAPANPASASPASASIKRPGCSSTALGAVMSVLLLGNIAHGSYVIQRDWSRMAPMSDGETVPSFELARVSGGTLSDQALRGDINVLVFWTTWCGQCDAEMPALSSLHARYDGHGVNIIGVNCDRGDQRGAVRRYLERRELPFPLLYDDGRLRAALRVTMYPHIVIVDAAGTLRYVHQGRVSESTLAEEIDTLLELPGSP
jgi:peroxiredoxin